MTDIRRAWVSVVCRRGGFVLALWAILGQAQQPGPPPGALPAPAAATAPPSAASNCPDLESRIVGDGSSAPNLLALSRFADTCLGVEPDQDVFAVATRAAFGSPPSVHSVNNALAIISQEVTNHPGSYLPEEARQHALLELKQTSQDVTALAIPGTGHTSVPRWHVNSMDGPVAVPELHISLSLNTACHPDARTEACRAALGNAKNWFRLVHLVESALTLYGSEALKARQAESKRRLDMWHAYRDEALPQFPWEWGLNSWYIAHHSPRNLDSSGQPMGPPPLPAAELIFLHPGTGVEWRDGVRNGSKAQPTLYLELAGVYRWSWDESTGAMQGARGVSAIMSYTHRQSETKVGYGLLFHWRKSAQFKPFSLAVTRSGSNTAVLLNVDLAEYFKDQLGYYQDAEKNIAALAQQTANPGAPALGP